MARSIVSASMERRVRAQREVLHRIATRRDHLDEPERGPFITISRQYGCMAYELAEQLAARLHADVPDWDYEVVDPKALEEMGNQLEIDSEVINGLSFRTRSFIEDWIGQLVSERPPETRVFGHLVRTLCSLAARGQVILVGRGGAAITQKLPNGIHVRVIAPLPWRIRNLSRLPDRAHEATVEYVKRADRERESFVRKYLRVDINSPELYHLTLNSKLMTMEEQIEVIASMVKVRSRQSQLV